MVTDTHVGLAATSAARPRRMYSGQMAVRHGCPVLSEPLVASAYVVLGAGAVIEATVSGKLLAGRV
jgi:hypothetical protein